MPLLKHQTPDGELLIWETLAIIEYLVELYPEAGLWPEGQDARAVARTGSDAAANLWRRFKPGMPSLRRGHPQYAGNAGMDGRCPGRTAPRRNSGINKIHRLTIRR